MIVMKSELMHEIPIQTRGSVLLLLQVNVPEIVTGSNSTISQLKMEVFMQ